MLKIFGVVILFISLAVKGQSYHPFPVENGKWVYDFHDGTIHFNNNEVTKSTLYELQDDTIISSTSYKKIKTNSIYAGAIREQDKRIYFYPDTATREYLLYDFNIEIGDIITIFAGDGATTAELESIEDVSASDGIHKQYNFGNYDTNTDRVGSSTWIEGIGSIHGLLRPNLSNDCGQWTCQDDLKCMISDFPFHYPDVQDACIVTSTISNIEIKNIYIYPNPSNGSFTLSFNNTDVKEIILVDILGNVIFNRKIKEEKEYKIPILKSGTYTLSIIDNNNHVRREKIVSAQ